MKSAACGVVFVRAGRSNSFVAVRCVESSIFVRGCLALPEGGDVRTGTARIVRVVLVRGRFLEKRNARARRARGFRRAAHSGRIFAPPTRLAIERARRLRVLARGAQRARRLARARGEARAEEARVTLSARARCRAVRLGVRACRAAGTLAGRCVEEAAGRARLARARVGVAFAGRRAAGRARLARLTPGRISELGGGAQLASKIVGLFAISTVCVMTVLRI